MTLAAAPFKLPSRSVLGLTETVLRLALSAAIPISAVMFVTLSF